MADAWPSKPISILVAEDDPSDRVLLEKAFRRAGLHRPLTFVDDGEALLDHLRDPESLRPDLVIIDLNMPRKSGFEALEDVRADPALRDIPMVVLTTSDDPGEVERAYALGVNAFVTKPLGYDRFLRVIELLYQFWSQGATLPG